MPAFSPCLSLLPDAAQPSPPAQGCSVAAGHAQHHPAQGLGRSQHRTAAAAWWPPSCLPRSPQRSSLPGPGAPCAVPGTQCRPRRTWGRGRSGAQGVGVGAAAAGGSPAGGAGEGPPTPAWRSLGGGSCITLRMGTGEPSRVWVEGDSSQLWRGHFQF